MPINTLYICYFGLREPLVQTQVLPYLRELAKAGVVVNLLTFEPDLGRSWTQADIEEARARLAAEGIKWFRLAYHKRPSVPATLYDIWRGASFAARMVRREGIRVLHARAHVPMAMAMLARARVECRLVFDVRGLMADEYADAGVWSESSLPFRAVKRLERAGVRRADQVVVLTQKVKDWLVAEGLAGPEKIEVIPCCVDFARYEMTTGGPAEAGRAAGITMNSSAGADADGEVGADAFARGEEFEVIYAGSVTGLYLLEEMGRFFLELRARVPHAVLRILTASPREAAEAVLRRTGLPDESFRVGKVSPAQVPFYLSRARLGLSFRKATFSQIAASPTKIPEYLSAGLPVVCNYGVGDTDELVERERVGVVVRDLGREGLSDAAARVLALLDEPGLAARCVETARRYFDLEDVGGARYANVYRRLGDGAAAGDAGDKSARRRTQAI
jgi:glycosyltransferase involved in cell wall biosynthesis